MRNADLSIDEDDAEDLLKEIEKSLKSVSGAKSSSLSMKSGWIAVWRSI